MHAINVLREQRLYLEAEYTWDSIDFPPLVGRGSVGLLVETYAALLDRVLQGEGALLVIGNASTSGETCAIPKITSKRQIRLDDKAGGGYDEG